MLSLRIALRYLFSRKSHSAINAITLVATCGVGVITAAMICVLSVYNGFGQLVGQLTSRFDPEIRIEPVRGKTFADTDSLRNIVLSHPDVELLNTTLEETVLMDYQGHQIPARMKGVQPVFERIAMTDSILLGENGFMLDDEGIDCCIPGIGLAMNLGMNYGFVQPFSVYCPRRVGKLNLLQPEEAFATVELHCSNVFQVNQADYDSQYFLCALPVARQLLGDSLLASAYELRLRDGANVQRIKQDLSLPGFRILDRYEQQADAHRIMLIEKWITYVLIVFILLIASFNAIGALSMLIIDKEQQIKTLRNLGADSHFIRQTFTYEGWLITGLGAAGGILLGIFLCFLQQEYGLIKLGNGDTSQYVVSSYPVCLELGDVLVTIASVAAIGWLSTWYTVRGVIKK